MNNFLPFNVSQSNLITSDEFFEEFFQSFFIKKTFSFKMGKSDFKVDLREDLSEYLIEADLPGIDKKNIHVNYINKFLVISAERKSTWKEKKYIKQEKEFGQFRRMFYVDNIQEEKISVYYENGVLNIVLPKK
ncbi:Hsp20 family protein, partial [Clostridium polynesiense]|uniref:Hsp20 family protein n=1 Tax=Clostridium polynesiense TaxID=1325933 RepID=UPI00058D472E